MSAKPTRKTALAMALAYRPRAPRAHAQPFRIRLTPSTGKDAWCRCGVAGAKASTAAPMTWTVLPATFLTLTRCCANRGPSACQRDFASGTSFSLAPAPFEESSSVAIAVLLFWLFITMSATSCASCLISCSRWLSSSRHAVSSLSYKTESRWVAPEAPGWPPRASSCLSALDVS